MSQRFGLCVSLPLLSQANRRLRREIEALARRQSRAGSRQTGRIFKPGRPRDEG